MEFYHVYTFMSGLFHAAEYGEIHSYCHMDHCLISFIAECIIQHKYTAVCLMFTHRLTLVLFPVWIYYQ